MQPIAHSLQAAILLLECDELREGQSAMLELVVVVVCGGGKDTMRAA